MSFFHNLNKTLDGIAARPEAAPLNERDMGKHNNATTGFKALAKKAGGGEKGEKIAGAQFQKMKKAGQLEEEGMSRAAKGYEKYGKEGMEALAKAGREGKALDPIRNKYDKYDDKAVEEGMGDIAKKMGALGKKVGGAVLNKLGHGDDEAMRKDLQRKMGMSQTGKKPEQKTTEADKSDAVEDEKERLAKQIYDLGFNIHQNDGYGQDTSQEQAMLAKLKAEFARLHPGEDAFKIGKALNDREYQQRQQQRNAEFQQNQQAKSRSTSIMQKAKNALGGMYEAGLPMVKGPDGKMVPKFAFDGSGPGDLKKSFADKIDSAKQEVEEMLGDVAAEAMRNALGGRQQVADEGNEFVNSRLAAIKAGKPSFKVGNKSYRVTGDTSDEKSMVEDDKEDLNPFTNYKKPRRDAPKRGEVTHGRHHDIKHDTTDQRYSGMIATRRSDAQGNSVGSETDAEGNTIDKRGRGRPKGPEKGPERTTAKAYKHKGGRKVKEGDGDPDIQPGMKTQYGTVVSVKGNDVVVKASNGDKTVVNIHDIDQTVAEGADQGQSQQIYNDLADIRAIAKQAQRGGEFPQGYASRLESVLYAAMKLIQNQQSGDAQVREAESTAKKDSHAERAGKRVAKDIEYDEKKKDGIHGKKRGAEDDRAEKAGKKVAKDIEYDDKKDKVKEDEPKKSKSKFKFGGSVYEALDAQLETLITEGMSVTVNMSQDDEHGEGRKNITVNADGEDAERLAELLKMAGISQQSSGCGCGQSPCGCDMVDENDPNWPSNTETSDNALQYSGGLNGPKSTGQSTTPVLASQLRRQVSMEQSAKVEQNLLNLYRTFGK